MTQKEMQIIKSIEYNGVDNQCWGIGFKTLSSCSLYDTKRNVRIPYPHFYVYREAEDNENPWLNYGQNSDFPDPDITLDTSDGQTIDFYYIKMED